MLTFPSNSIEDWLQREAHLVAGRSFVFNECSYLPVSLATENRPVGFLITHGEDVQFVPAESEEGIAPTLAWEQVANETDAKEAGIFPSEYWVG